MDEDIGRKLRRVREGRGLSQRQLARRAGVANASISQIEAGKLNPTVSMLKKVLDGIPLGLGEFFSGEDARDDRVFFRASELVEIAEGGVTFRQVGASLSGRSIQLLRESYRPGAGTGRHAMTHEGEECGLVLAGRLHVVVGEQQAVLGPGDAYYFRSDTPHSFRNSGSEVCELVSACSPPTF